MNHKLAKMDILDLLTSAVVNVDEQWQIYYMNQSAEALFGQSLQRSKKYKITQLIHSDEFAEQLRTAEQLHEVYVIRECVVDRLSLDSITIDCVVTPLASETGKPHYLLELNRVDRRLQIANEKMVLNQQQAIQELVRGLAHEVKNPLGGLRGAAQLLELELESDELKEYTRIIIAEADRLKTLVNSLLGSNHLPELEKINIHEVLEHVMQLAQSDPHCQVNFDKDYDPSIPEFFLDRGQLIQIVLNIVNNAIRATHYQGQIILKTRVARQFTIREKRYRLVLRVDICDDGEGIPEHLRDKLFLPMVSGHAKGSGLGLSIAQSLLRRYEGVIYYQSEPGNTCFSILIPLDDKGEQP